MEKQSVSFFKVYGIGNFTIVGFLTLDEIPFFDEPNVKKCFSKGVGQGKFLALFFPVDNQMRVIHLCCFLMETYSNS